MATNLTASIARETDIRDIVPPVDIVSAWSWHWWGLGILAFAMAMFAMWKRRQKKKSQIPVIPPLPPHVRAKLKLQEALALIAQPKPFVIAVSDTSRHFLEERFDFHAPERTTEEFLQAPAAAAAYKRTAANEYQAQKRGGKGRIGHGSRDDDYVSKLFTASTHAYVFIFSDKGKVYVKKVYEIPEAAR